MKIRKKPKGNGTTKVERDLTKGEAKIWHTQGYKLNSNYHSVDASYGIQLVVGNDDESIEDGILRAEVIVERALADKYTESEKLLEKIS
jgi:hypothetical protein